MRKVKIMFVTASPSGQENLASGEELREIQDALSRGPAYDRYEFVPALAARKYDFATLLDLTMPDIVHFSGHGTETEEILFVGDDGEAAPVSKAELQGFFKSSRARVRLLVLSACYSQPQATALIRHVPFVVGMKRAIGDTAARFFAARFYQKLFLAGTIQEAWQAGVEQIRAREIHEEDIPVLRHGPGDDPLHTWLLRPEELDRPEARTRTIRTSARPSRVSARRWGQLLDLQLAAKNCRTDFYGDWYRDPWDWPELDWVTRGRQEVAFGRVVMDRPRSVAPVDVPKEGFATRPAVVLDPLDRLVYQALVDHQSDSLTYDLKDWVYGWRPRNGGTPGVYSTNAAEWKLFRGALRRPATRFDHLLTTDIASFFSSIRTPRLIDQVVLRATDYSVAEALAAVLSGYDGMAGRPGIPQRAMPSSVLANFYLGPIDSAMEGLVAIRGERKSAVVRWMDDIWLFADDPGWLRAAQVHLEQALRDQGLSINLSKTQIYEGDRVAEAAQRLEHSAVDKALRWGEKRPAPLEELVNQIVASPETADRTTIRFATTRIRKKSLWTFIPDLVNVAARMPQGADHLARLFQASESWRDLKGWYMDYCASPWATTDWSKAQLGTMFPSSARPGKRLVHFFMDTLAGHPRLTLVALASQRLSVWDRKLAIGAIRSIASDAGDPFERRVLALSALSAGDDARYVRSLLSQHPDTAATLGMLEDRSFVAPSPSSDFVGGTS
jgi:hypothetical protein